MKRCIALIGLHQPSGVQVQDRGKMADDPNVEVTLDALFYAP